MKVHFPHRYDPFQPFQSSEKRLRFQCESGLCECSELQEGSEAEQDSLLLFWDFGFGPGFWRLNAESSAPREEELRSMLRQQKIEAGCICLGCRMGLFLACLDAVCAVS